MTEPMQKQPDPSTAPTLGGAVSQALDRLEILAGRLGIGGFQEAVDLLDGLDTARERIDQLEGRISRKTAEGQFESITGQVRSHAAVLLKTLGGPEALRRLRQERALPETGQDGRWWWYLDQQLARQSRQGRKRLLYGVIGALAGLAVIVLLYSLFLRPDPALSARYTADQDARDLISRGEYAAAVERVDQGLQFGADDPELLTLKGVALVLLERADEADSVFQKAEVSAGGRDALLAMRADDFILAGKIDLATQDAQELLERNPNSYEGYMLMGAIHEAQKDYRTAMEDFGKAYDIADAESKPQQAAMARIRMAGALQMLNSQFPELETATP